VNPHEAVVYQIDIEGKYLKMASILVSKIFSSCLLSLMSINTLNRRISIPCACPESDPLLRRPNTTKRSSHRVTGSFKSKDSQRNCFNAYLKPSVPVRTSVSIMLYISRTFLARLVVNGLFVILK
jgi:hypothetical protein